MKGLLTMRAQLCSQAVRGGEPVGGDGDGGDGDGFFVDFIDFIMPRRLLRSEPSAKTLKKDKARRKKIKLGVFMVDCCFASAKRETR
jgi:hypothetical protein